MGILLNIQVKRENAFFCSQFVTSIFEEIGKSLVPKCAALTTPADLERSEALELVFRGKVQLFDSSDLSKYARYEVTEDTAAEAQ